MFLLEFLVSIAEHRLNIFVLIAYALSIRTGTECFCHFKKGTTCESSSYLLSKMSTNFKYISAGVNVVLWLKTVSRCRPSKARMNGSEPFEKGGFFLIFMFIQKQKSSTIALASANRKATWTDDAQAIANERFKYPVTLKCTPWQLVMK